ncbi:MAG: sensor histidine kinase [Alphaproteobacteria bacterium]|nr:MAG: sensor histidine kinase [Alphaproteobacteria bacterium]PZO33963.1 MAG: sensor histidine kinase [Alphaproteobacteria bacterium]
MSEAPASVSEAGTGLNRRAVGGWLLRPGRSLTRRLVWLASAWIALALIVTGAVLTYQFQESALRRLGSVLSATIDEAVIATTVMPDGSVLTTPIMDARTLRLLSGKYWAVAEPDGRGGLRTLVRSASLGSEGLAVPRGLPAQLAEAAGVNITYNAVGPNDEPLMVAASQKTLPGRAAPIVFLAGLDRSDIDADARQFATLAWVTLGLLGIGLLIAVFLQVRIGLRPLYDLRDEISNVRKGKAARIERAYPAEISPLAEQVNRLLDHNQDVVERQRTHVGNLAHALKTPLSVMLAEASGDPSQLADIVRRQSDVMKGQVDHHLRRARAAARSQGLGERTPVPEVLDEMSVMLERVFQSKSVEIDWRAPDSLGFLGERQDLQEILGNLMENACKWCARKVRVSAGTSGLGQMIVVVEDDGPGLAADRYDEVMKRGARADEDTPGSGLGLAIVDDLTRAYGGRLTLGPSDMGGLKAILTLPAAEL